MAMADQVNFHQLSVVSAPSPLDKENPLSPDPLFCLLELILRLFLDYINKHYLLLYQIDRGNFAVLSVNYCAQLPALGPYRYSHYTPLDANVRLPLIN